MPSIAFSEPTRRTLCGNSPQRVLRRYFLSTRPLFFPASILPILVGSAWGWRDAGTFNSLIFMVALIAVVLMHAGANVINDVVDDATGADRLNNDRYYPFTGGSRFIQNGIMTSAEMTRWGIGLLTTGAVLGVLLIALKGLVILAIGMLGISLGIAYSLPPLSLVSRGFGEFAVSLGFGILPCIGSYWLQTGMVSSNAVLLSLPLAFWITAVLLANEWPDVKADTLAGKRTLVIRLGLRRSWWLFMALQISAFGAFLVAVNWMVIPAWGLIVPGGLLALVIFSVRTDHRSRKTLRRGILCALWTHTLGAAWLLGISLSPL